MTRRELKSLVRLDEMVVKSNGHGMGKDITTANNFVDWNQNVSDLPRPVQTLKNSRAVGAGYASGPCSVSAATAMMEVLKDGKFVVLLVDHYATQLRRNWCNQTVGQVALPRQGSDASR